MNILANDKELKHGTKLKIYLKIYSMKGLLVNLYI